MQYDAADHRDVKLPPAQWLRYLFTFADQPGSQIDTIFWAVALGDTYAVYPSRILPPSPDTQLVAWRKQGFEWVPALLRRGENRIAVRVLDRGAYRIGEGIQVEKVEITGG